MYYCMYIHLHVHINVHVHMCVYNDDNRMIFYFFPTLPCVLPHTVIFISTPPYDALSSMVADIHVFSFRKTICGASEGSTCLPHKAKGQDS